MDWRLLLVFVIGVGVASLLNAAVYAWAWNSRLVSPWQATPKGVAPRTWFDRTPIVGWLRLRRDASVLGRGFWVRPLLVEIAFGAALALLYWWEVGRLGLIEPQLEGIAIDPTGAAGAALSGFVLHAVLAALMLVASLIDIDEKTIPDEVTVPGVLLGLLLAAALPMGLLPNVEDRVGAPVVGEPLSTRGGAPAIGPYGGPLWVEPTHASAPNSWPPSMSGSPQRGSLVLGLGCYLFWCFALTNRIWRGRRSFFFTLGVLLRRVARDLTSTPLREITLLGVLLISMVWFAAGGAWVGLLSALVGMAASGGLVWAVRLIGSAALRKEAMGFGDVTLMMMIGAFLGWQAGMLVFFVAPLAGLAIGLVQLLLRRGDVIPYGPFLCLGAALIVLRWGSIWPAAESAFSLGEVVPAVLVVCLAALGFLLLVWRLIKTQVLGVSEDWEDDPPPA